VTGEIWGSPEATGVFRVVLYALNERKERALVDRFTMDVQHTACAAASGSMSTGAAGGLAALVVILVVGVAVAVALSQGMIAFGKNANRYGAPPPPSPATWA
jgi:hypothetical protein